MLKIRKKMGKKGLTLIELLVTIAVLAIVAAIAVPVVTNVVNSTNSRAAAQTQSDIADFVNKYEKTGAYTYDPDSGNFSGYVDLDGDGAATEDEKIEELSVDTDKFNVVIDPAGDTPPTDTSGNFYDNTLTATFSVSNAEEATSATSEDAESIPEQDHSEDETVSRSFSVGSDSIGTYTSLNSPIASSQSATNHMVWQVFYAHEDVLLDEIGFSPYNSGSNTFDVRVAQASSLTGFSGTPTQIIGSWNQGYMSGAVYSRATEGYQVNAGNYFIVGFSESGPYYRTVVEYNKITEWTDSNSGSLVVSAVPRVYYKPQVGGDSRGIPSQLGGASTGSDAFTEINGSVVMYNLKVSLAP